MTELKKISFENKPEIYMSHPSFSNETTAVVGTEKLQVKDLSATGLLWYINRVAFHPQGFALAIDPGDNTLYLVGNGDEPWEYQGFDERAPFEAINDLFTRIREASKKNTSLPPMPERLR